jgi:hypothetical protein
MLFTYSGILDDAIPAQLKRPHTIIYRALKRWPRRSAGTLAFVVVDDGKINRLRRALAPPDYALVARRPYRGAFSFTVFTYRAL